MLSGEDPLWFLVVTGRSQSGFDGLIAHAKQLTPILTMYSLNITSELNVTKLYGTSKNTCCLLETQRENGRNRNAERRSSLRLLRRETRKSEVRP